MRTNLYEKRIAIPRESEVNDVFIMGAAMKNRPYLVNDEALPPGYWHYMLNGEGLTEGWAPPRYKVERSSGRLGDVLGWIGGVPLYSERAKNLLTELSRNKVRFCQLGEVKGSMYWVMAAIPVANVLDEKRSAAQKASNGMIRSVQRFSFDASLDAAPTIFCLPGRADCETFAKAEVPKAVVEMGFTGFQFRDPGLPSLRRIYLGEDVNVYPGVKP